MTQFEREYRENNESHTLDAASLVPILLPSVCNHVLSIMQCGGHV